MTTEADALSGKSNGIIVPPDAKLIIRPSIAFIVEDKVNQVDQVLCLSEDNISVSFPGGKLNNPKVCKFFKGWYSQKNRELWHLLDAHSCGANSQLMEQAQAKIPLELRVGLLDEVHQETGLLPSEELAREILDSATIGSDSLKPSAEYLKLLTKLYGKSEQNQPRITSVRPYTIFVEKYGKDVIVIPLYEGEFKGQAGQSKAAQSAEVIKNIRQRIDDPEVELTYGQWLAVPNLVDIAKIQDSYIDLRGPPKEYDGREVRKSVSYYVFEKFIKSENNSQSPRREELEVLLSL